MHCRAVVGEGLAPPAFEFALYESAGQRTLTLVPKRPQQQGLLGISCRQRGERLRDRDKSQSLRNSPLFGITPLTAKPKLLVIANPV